MSDGFHELPSGWIWVRVAEAGAVQLGRQRSPQHHSGEYMRPYLRVANVYENRIDVSDVLRMNFTPAEAERYTLKYGDILLNEGQSRELVGRPAMFRDELPEACFQNTLVRFQSNEGVLPHYALSVFRYYFHAGHFQAICKWTTNIAHLGAERFSVMPFPLAPHSEQKRIADKLDALLARMDACRVRLDRVPGMLKRFRQSVLAAATSGELTREWREERGLDEAWQQATVGSLLTDVRYGTSKKCAYEPSKTPVLRIPNVVDGTVSHDDMKYADFDEGEQAKLALAPGDLLMIRSNGSVGLVGRTALVSEREAGFLFAGYLIRLRVDAALASPAYLSMFLASPGSRARIELTARSTTGVNNINAEEIRAFPVVLPPLEEQYEIVMRIDGLFEIADRLDHRIASAQALIQQTTPSVLAKAFRGDLVPQEPNDEAASSLLALLRTRPASAGNTDKLKPGKRTQSTKGTT